MSGNPEEATVADDIGVSARLKTLCDMKLEPIAPKSLTDKETLLTAPKPPSDKKSTGPGEKKLEPHKMSPGSTDKKDSLRRKPPVDYKKT